MILEFQCKFSSNAYYGPLVYPEQAPNKALNCFFVRVLRSVQWTVSGLAKKRTLKRHQTTESNALLQNKLCFLLNLLKEELGIRDN